MTKAFIQTTRTTALIDADTLVMDNLGGDKLFVYCGEKLTGVFALSEVVDAHLTERKSNGTTDIS